MNYFSYIYNMDKKRQYRSSQGRSPKQIESSYKLVAWSFIGLVVTFLITKLFS